MSELIDNLRDHRFQEQDITIEEKVLRNEAAGRIEDLEKAVLIYMSENPPTLDKDSDFFGGEEDREFLEKSGFSFEFHDNQFFGTADEMRVKWFIWHTDKLNPEWDRQHNTFTTPWQQ